MGIGGGGRRLRRIWMPLGEEREDDDEKWGVSEEKENGLNWI